MAKEIYVKSNFLFIDDTLGIIRRFPSTSSDFGKDAVNWKIKNHRTKEVVIIPITEVATWYEETGVTPYSEATLDALLEANTGN